MVKFENAINEYHVEESCIGHAEKPEKNKAFSFINVLGLSLGIACSLLILLWVKDERSVDNLHANGDRLYIVYERQYVDDKTDGGYFAPGVLANEMKRRIPEIERASGFAWQADTPDRLTGMVGNAGMDAGFCLPRSHRIMRICSSRFTGNRYSTFNRELSGDQGRIGESCKEPSHRIVTTVKERLRTEYTKMDLCECEKYENQDL